MQADLFLVLGMAILCLAIPAFLSAYSDERRPVAAMLMLVMGGGAIAYAFTLNPEGYRVEDLPEVIFRVIGHYSRHLTE